MANYIAKFGHWEDDQFINIEVGYDFDGNYDEHVNYLWNTFFDLFFYDDGSTVNVYQETTDKENRVIEGAYEGYHDRYKPAWVFWRVTQTNPMCYDDKIEMEL